jgi:hypothetical protein
MLTQPQHVRKRRDVVVPGRRKVRESGHHRVGRGGYAELTADHQRQRGSERIVVQAASVSCDVRHLKGDGGDVPASQQVGGCPAEQLGTVLVVGQTPIEREQRDGVAPERVLR